MVRAAISAHGLRKAEKFVQEVFWRGYFKGWLEHRPGVWAAYRTGFENDLERADRDTELSERLQAATTGATGIDCFDAWARELLDTGYVHNHARMWFASIWIFSLGLPWRLGADFFYRHLLDGDPASNTLGWRWVAGLHTRGKTYMARVDNINRYTGNRFNPSRQRIEQHRRHVVDEEPNGHPAPLPLRRPIMPATDVPSVWLLTEEDCCLEDFDLDRHDIRGVATLKASHLRASLPVSDLVTAFEDEALADSAQRTGRQTQFETATDPAWLADWAATNGASQIITSYVPVGPLRDWLHQATPALKDSGIALCEWQRPWDIKVWPHAKAGYFKVKNQIPKIVAELGLA